eukprot:3511720-Rhodomonas_salina.1
MINAPSDEKKAREAATRYAMPGTGIDRMQPHAARRLESEVQVASTPPIVQRVRFAMCSTEIGYAAL